MKNDRNWLAWGIAASALACVWLVAASSALAASGTGSAEIRFAQHDQGRTLSGQGVRVTAAAPAGTSGAFLSLPISTVDPQGTGSAGSDGSLRFKQGKQAVVLSGLRFDFAAGALAGSLGGKEISVFELGAAAAVNPTTGRVTIGGGKLRLTAAAAAALKQKLGLERALRRDGVGMVWLAAQANPTRVFVTLDGASSSLALDSVYDIDKVEGKTCGPLPAVATSDVTFASLNLSGVTPASSADGKAITWNAIPATLTAAGSAAFGLPQYQEGQALDPVTVTVGLG